MSKKLTASEFQARLNEVFGNQFILVGEYVDIGTPTEILCTRCNNIIKKRPNKMVNREHEGCYICNKKNGHRTTESFQEELDTKYPNEFELLEEYKTSRTPIKMRRKSCGHIQQISPDNALRGKGCPECGLRQSSYMNIVEDYLNQNKIEYEKEKRFTDCRNIKPLPFDYYLPKLNICIEVDGEFHFKHNSRYKSLNERSEYERVVFRDSIKTDYCLKHGIKLIRLSYTKKNHFAEILDKELYANTEVTVAI